MTSIDKYLEIIKKGISDREVLMAMEPLANIEDLAPLFDEKLTYKEFIDINRLLRQKYILKNPEDTHELEGQESGVSLVEVENFDVSMPMDWKYLIRVPGG